MPICFLGRFDLHYSYCFPSDLLPGRMLIWSGLCTCRVFMFWLLAFLIHNNAVTLFRMIGALARNLVVANALGALALLVLLLLGGFVLTKAYVHHWWIWACEPLPSPVLTTRLPPFLVTGEIPTYKTWTLVPGWQDNQFLRQS